MDPMESIDVKDGIKLYDYETRINKPPCFGK